MSPSPDRRVPRVLLVTDSRRLVPGGTPAARIDALVRQAREAFAAGVDAIHLREPDVDAASLLAAACAMAPLGRLIVGERADVALAAGAAGVHLRGDGPPAARVRALIGDAMTLSRAVHAEREARQWGSDGALDWLVAGTAFETASKPGRAIIGIAGLAAMARASRLPVVAIGGITDGNAPAVRAAGARGVAGIGLFLQPIRRDYVDRLRERSLE